jgi:hypothetical protein
MSANLVQGGQVMKNSLKRTDCLLVATLWIGLSLPVSAATLFDNSGNDLFARFNPGSLEVGDEIILASTGNLTYFSFEYWGTASGANFAGSIQADVRFYLNTGPEFHGYAAPNAIPFYDSGLFPVASPTDRGTFIFTAGLDFPSGGLSLTSTDMTWSVQFTGMGAGDAVGVDIYSPPVVGHDYPDYWQNDGGWTLLTNPVGAMDFAAVMETPEPPSLTLSLAGGFGVLMALRRFHRKE